MTEAASSAVVWRMTPLTKLAAIVASAFAGFLFYKGFDFIFYMWFNKEEYSHGVMIPFISAFLIWQRKDILERMPFTGSAVGVGLTLLGLVLFILGRMSALVLLINYSMIIVVAGLFLSFMGWQAFRIILVPVLLLFFMIPLPGFLYETFSGKMQLISSSLGVAVIRLFNIAVFLEGNVIDLGTMKLQVVEACNGLRYLFPLMTLGVIAAYFYKEKLWKRAIVVLSSIPIAVLMNSLRIAVIGILVDRWGRSMAEGFLHDFEGWVVFMVCTAVLVGEMWLLSRIGEKGRPLRQVFGLEFPSPSPKDAPVRMRSLPNTFVAAFLVIAIASVLSAVMPERANISVARKTFSEFPLKLGDWEGHLQTMEKIYIDALNFDDYLLADFVDKKRNGVVNLYVGYYATQLAEKKVPHSPRACLPGGGWRIVDIREQVVGNDTPPMPPLKLNRVVIQNGDEKQLVYYWFQQRGRDIASEYSVKWYIFWDSLTRNRTDGALVRLITPVLPGEDMKSADSRLTGFLRRIEPLMSEYVPG